MFFWYSGPRVQPLVCNACKSSENRLYKFQGGLYCKSCCKEKKRASKEKQLTSR
jgi:hypothetical protein